MSRKYRFLSISKVPRCGQSEEQNSPSFMRNSTAMWPLPTRHGKEMNIYTLPITLIDLTTFGYLSRMAATASAALINERACKCDNMIRALAECTTSSRTHTQAKGLTTESCPSDHLFVRPSERHCITTKQTKQKNKISMKYIIGLNKLWVMLYSLANLL